LCGFTLAEGYELFRITFFCPPFTILIVMDWLVRVNLSSLALERLKFTLPMEIGILPLAGLEAEEGLEPDRAF